LPVETQPTSVEIVSEDPLRCAVRITRPLGTASTIEQTIALDAASPRVDIHSKVDWKEHRTLLRALFPTAVVAQEATYEVQFGAVRRPTHRSTTWDAAKFEVCGHRWSDLSERGRGVAILNDGKYGHSCHDSTLGLSLLRAPKHPDPDADIGTHEFSYAIVPHGGSWQDAGIPALAEAFNTPPVAYALNAGEEGPLGTSWSPCTIEAGGGAGVLVSALTTSEDGKGRLLRLWECHGGRGEVVVRWNMPAASARRVDLLDRPLQGDCQHEGGVTRLRVRPWELVTIRVD